MLPVIGSLLLFCMRLGKAPFQNCEFSIPFGMFIGVLIVSRIKKSNIAPPPPLVWRKMISDIKGATLRDVSKVSKRKTLPSEHCNSTFVSTVGLSIDSSDCSKVSSLFMFFIRSKYERSWMLNRSGMAHNFRAACFCVVGYSDFDRASAVPSSGSAWRLLRS